MLVAGVLFAVDVPVEHAITSIRLRGFFRDLLNAVEAFGNGFGVLLILLAVATLDPLRRKQLPLLAACAFGGGIAADVVKLLVSRSRPRAVELADATVWDTFNGFLPWLSAGSNGQSFPSAHTATAAGLAVGLAYLYPQGRRFFFSLAAGVGIQRLFVSAHFPSDVFLGFTLGVFIGRAVLPWEGRLAGWFTSKGEDKSTELKVFAPEEERQAEEETERRHAA